MSSTLEAIHLSKWYGQVMAVNQVSFALDSGVTALLGANGAGKSTLLKLFAGQLRPSQGSARVLGTPVWNHHSLFEHMGFCPEQDRFYERMSGREFLSSMLRIHGRDESDVACRVDAALDRMHLRGVQYRKIASYSKGMRQCLKMAQAISHDPRIMILDEPLAGMDPVMRGEMIDCIRKWGEEGKCILISSHVLHEVEVLTRKILLLHQGRLLAQGSIEDVRALIDRHPHHVVIRCSAPRRLAEKLVSSSDVIGIRVQGNRTLTVETREPRHFYLRLPELLLREDIQLEEMYSPDDSLETVFHYLVSRQGEAG